MCVSIVSGLPADFRKLGTDSIVRRSESNFSTVLAECIVGVVRCTRPKFTGRASRRCAEATGNYFKRRGNTTHVNTNGLRRAGRDFVYLLFKRIQRPETSIGDFTYRRYTVMREQRGFMKINPTRETNQVAFRNDSNLSSSTLRPCKRYASTRRESQFQ